MLIAALTAIQARLGYVPHKELVELAAKIGQPIDEVFAVASFYPHFRLTPPPKHEVRVCTDLSCHLKNAAGLLHSIQELAGPAAEVSACSCLGQCDAPVAAIVDHQIVRAANPDDVLSRLRNEAATHSAARHSMHDSVIEGAHVDHGRIDITPPVAKGPFKTDPYASRDEHYSTLRDLCTNFDPGATIAKLKNANLRGLGGAGFPLGMKWETVAKSPSPEKYIIANADESEVGTFKDREIMKCLPHLLVEAMAIAGVVTGATRGYIYIRHEYPEQIQILADEIRRAMQLGALGENVFASGKRFDLTIFVSPGGYIQGEETALMEAIEGRRGQPRNKPVDFGMKAITAFYGLFQKPTVVNNVESLIYVPLVLSKGIQHFKSLGATPDFAGLKWIGISGDVVKPGVYEVPFGTTYRDAIDQYAGGVTGGKPMKAFAPSGPSGGFLPPAMLDLRMDFDVMAKAGSMLGSSAIIVLAEGRDLVDAALNETRFFRNESCGKCVPCRLGTQKLADILAGVLAGTARDEDLANIDRLASTMYRTSICGLGQFAPMPIKSIAKHWPHELQRVQPK